MKFMYLGYSQEMVDKSLAQYRASIDPPEKRGPPNYYHITKEDGYAEAKEKEARTLAWKDARCAEYLEGLQKLQKAMVMHGVTFKAGQHVEVSERSELGMKLMKMCRDPNLLWKICVEEKPKVEEKHKKEEK
jgi:hypothetical protein